LANNEIVSDQKSKPVLDERALERLLEAAFVLQEHNRERQTLEQNLGLQSSQPREQKTEPSQPEAPGPAGSMNDFTLTLAQIVETQRQIQLRHLDLENVMSLLAERIVSITGAAGAAIGILDAKKVRYRAVSGARTLPPGAEVPMDKALCHACLRVGQVIRCQDVNTEFLVDVEECRRRGIQSMIAVPIYHDGDVTGALELYFATARAFTEQDVHSCQLMAGLATEAFARDDEVTRKKSLAAERATMLEALEKLKPNLAALVGNQVNPVNKEPDVKDRDARGQSAGSAASANNFVCPKCGHELIASEQFCGKCGSPRVKSRGTPSMQSKVASLWQMQQTKRGDVPVASVTSSSQLPVPPSEAEPASRDAQPVETLDHELLAPLQGDFKSDAASVPDKSAADLVRRLTEPESSAGADFKDSEFEKESPATATSENALVKSEDAVTWSSAAKARDFLEQFATARNKSPFARFWSARRGDIYLAVAVILVAVVIRWGIWSSHSVSATAGPVAATRHRRPASDADLSMLDKMLIGLGLAEAPEAPEYRGNPQTQVWVDTHTALYYCPGTDLYGKTSNGKYTTQRDAQLDQFEPAYRKACD
jgi:putative methionine-R-sulfoxide reductase with GAF domain/predicted RNA-binding Zn-ribbon protein involved in translation (DUF1610 family)